MAKARQKSQKPMRVRGKRPSIVSTLGPMSVRRCRRYRRRFRLKTMAQERPASKHSARRPHKHRGRRATTGRASTPHMRKGWTRYADTTTKLSARQSWKNRGHHPSSVEAEGKRQRASQRVMRLQRRQEDSLAACCLPREATFVGVRGRLKSTGDPATRQCGHFLRADPSAPDRARR
jgi:hypothetical protein